jgi:hypothetical protein
MVTVPNLCIEMSKPPFFVCIPNCHIHSILHYVLPSFSSQQVSNASGLYLIFSVDFKLYVLLFHFSSGFVACFKYKVKAYGKFKYSTHIHCC